MATPSLEDLFTSFLRDGDERALEQLLRRGAPPLRALARRLGADAEDTEDLIQETIVAAIDAGDRYDGARPLLPWLKGILTFRAAKLARGRLRRRRLHGPLDGAEPVDAAVPAPADAAAHNELGDDVFAAIERLPEAYRAPVRQFLLRGASPREIAQDLGEQRSTVRVRLHRGLQQLRALLSRWSGTSGASGALLALLLARPSDAAARVRLPVVRRLATAAVLATALTLVLAGALRSTRGDAAVPALAIAAAIAGDVADAGAANASDAATVLAAARESPPDTRAANVRVVDASGAPVRGVGLTFVPLDGSDPVLHRRRAVSDAAGNAACAAAAAGRWLVRADRGGELVLDLDTDHGDARAGKRLVVAAGSAVRGRVLDGADQPVAGARIWLASDRDGPWRGDDVATSDAAGQFVLANVPAGALLAARHDMWARSEPVRAPDGGDATLHLDAPGGTVQVRVHGADGDPLRDALVFVGESMDATAIGLADGAVPWRAPPFEGRTDADGRFRSAAIAPGAHAVFVRAAGHVPASTRVAVAVGRCAAVDVRLQPAGTVRGVLRDDRGEPLSGEVVLRSGDPVHAVDLLTDERGCFRLECAPACIVDLAARAPGCTPRSLAIAVTARTAHDVEIVLPRAAPLHGRVQRDDRGALAGAAVRATWPPSALAEPRQFAAVDANGAFALPRAGEAAPRLAVRLPGEALWRDVDACAQVDGDTLAIVLPPDFAATGSLAGTLALADGTPLASARLFVRSEREAWAEIGRSDARGAFRLGALPTGSWTLFAETTCPELPTLPCGPFALGAGEQRTVHAVAEPHGTADIELVRADGGDVGDLAATLVDRSRQRRSALSTQARWRQALLPGDYLLNVMGSRVRWIDDVPVHVAAGATTTVRLELAPAERYTLSLLGLPPDAPRAMSIELRERRGPWSARFTLAPDAPLRLAAMLAPGEYELTCAHAAIGTWTGTFACSGADDEARALAVQLARR